jgi:hypothetical protein
VCRSWRDANAAFTHAAIVSADLATWAVELGCPESAVDEALECPLGADPDALAPLVGALSLEASQA